MREPTELRDMLQRTYAGERVLVTGHTGFKGSWLTLWLAELGAQVTGYAQEPATDPSAFVAMNVARDCDHLVGDIRDLARLTAVVHDVRPRAVFHLAAQALVRASYDAPMETLTTNVIGTANILEAVRGLSEPCAVVIITSDKCYENREWLYGYREEDAMGGHDPYSMSKGAAELVVASWRRSYFGSGSPIRVASARAGNVVGGGDWSRDRLVVDAIRALAAGQDISVRHPEAVRPWQHVLEPLAGYLMLGCHLLRPDGEAYATGWNFGPRTDLAHPARDVVEGLIRHWGSGGWSPTLSDGRHEAQTLRLSIEKAAHRLGWRPRWDLDETLRRTVDWYRTHADGGGAEALRAMVRAQIADYLAHG